MQVLNYDSYIYMIIDINGLTCHVISEIKSK